VAIKGDAGFDQAEVISAQLLRIPPVSSLAGNLVAGRRLFIAHERVGLGSYLFALTGAAAFCSGLCGLAVTSVFETEVPRWFILVYGFSCVLLLLLGPVLRRPRQQLRSAGRPVYAGPTDARVTALWAGHEKEEAQKACGKSCHLTL
jgi:hypothetical protein